MATSEDINLAIDTGSCARSGRMSYESRGVVGFA